MAIDWSAVLGLMGVAIGAVVSYFATRQAAERTFDAAQLTITANAATAEQDRKDATQREYRASKRARYDDLAGELADLNVAIIKYSNSMPKLTEDELQTGTVAIITTTNDMNRKYSVFADQQLRDALRFISSISSFVGAPLNGADTSTYALIERRLDGSFVWTGTDDLSRESKVRATVSSAMVIRECVNWCIDHISFEMGYNEVWHPKK